MGFQAILVTVGAQGTKWLGLPGENLIGAYHAKDLVFHYNLLPPFSNQEYQDWQACGIDRCRECHAGYSSLADPRVKSGSRSSRWCEEVQTKLNSQKKS